MGSAGITVGMTPRRHEAELMRLHLEAAGITAWLADEGVIGANPLLANAVGWIKVQVATADEETARVVLATTEDEGAAEGACLSCGAPMAEDDEKCSACDWTWL